MKEYVEKRNIPWHMLIGISLVNCVIVAYYIARPGSLELLYAFFSMLAILYPIVLGLLCWKGSSSLLWPRSIHPVLLTSRRFSPVLLGMGLFCYALGQLTLILQIEFPSQRLDFPTLQQFVTLGMYPFFIWAFLLLPEQRISRLSRLRLLLDSLVIMAAGATFCYYYFLTPLISRSSGGVLEKITISLFPQADLVLMFFLLLVALRCGERELRPALVMLGGAILCLFLIHVAHLYQALYRGYEQLSLANVLYLPGFLLIAGAAQTVRRMFDKKELVRAPSLCEGADLPPPPERGKILLPSALVLIFGLLVLTICLGGGGEGVPGQITIVYIGGFIVLMLMVLRQFLAVHEISILQRSMLAKNFSLSRLHTQLEQLATSDPLTGLCNHRALVEKLNEALGGGNSPKTRTCAVIFMDIDNFKNINDIYGHLVGDVVLRNFGGLVKSSLRAADCVGRWGGEEFLAILPDIHPLEAYHLAEKIRTLVSERVLAGNGELKVTCSLGVATYPQDAADGKNLILCADQAMYAAKRLGRNQTRTAHEPLVLAMGMSGEEVETTEEAEMLAVVESLSAMLSARDPYTGQHARRVAALSLKLAIMLGLRGSEAYLVSLGGLLHDVGKVAMPDAILLKRGKFDEAERACMAQHPITGAEVLTPIPTLQTVAEIVRAHHERMDGSGYPDGLKGEEIPLGARVVAVADSYDAMVTTRVYRQARSSAEALQELQHNSGSLFDPRVVAALAELVKTRQPVVEVA